MFKRSVHRFASWIAICAILMASFAPAISHAKASNDFQGLDEICTVTGVKHIPSSSPTPADQPSAIHLQHCAYCSLASDKAYLPSSNTQLGLVVIPSYSQFFIEYESPVLQAHFQSSHPLKHHLQSKSTLFVELALGLLLKPVVYSQAYDFRLRYIMIYLNIPGLIASREVQWGRKITFTEIANATGISRMTLHRMTRQDCYNTITAHLDKLCVFFNCDLTELVEYVPNYQIQTQSSIRVINI